MPAVSSALLPVGVGFAPRGFVDADEENENAPGLLSRVAAAKVSLARGIAAAGSQGKALSPRFEIEDGKLQLSL